MTDIVSELTRYISLLFVISINDGRIIEGRLICTDKDCNLILADAKEYYKVDGSKCTSRREGESRSLGMVVIPSKSIESIRTNTSELKLRKALSSKLARKDNLFQAKFLKDIRTEKRVKE